MTNNTNGDRLGFSKKFYATAKALQAGVFVAGARELNTEEHTAFHPHPDGIEEIRAPNQYDELKGYGFKERALTTNDGKTIWIWEKQAAAPDKPHFLLFHGNRGHWGDSGPGQVIDGKRTHSRRISSQSNHAVSGVVEDDRHARLKFLKQIARSGAGITAVSLRGFGKSEGTPGEEGFREDIKTVVNDLCEQPIDHRKLVVVGESMGTWAATQAAVEMTKRDKPKPPALLCLQNPFTSFAKASENVVERKFHVHVAADILDTHVLNNHFYTAKLFHELNPATRIFIATSGQDKVVPKKNSHELMRIAKDECKLTAHQYEYENAEHHNIPPHDYAKTLLVQANEACGITKKPFFSWALRATDNNRSDGSPALP